MPRVIETTQVELALVEIYRILQMVLPAVFADVPPEAIESIEVANGALLVTYTPHIHDGR